MSETMNWFEREMFGRPAYELDSGPALMFLLGTLSLFCANPVLWVFFWSMSLKYGFENWPGDYPPNFEQLMERQES